MINIKIIKSAIIKRITLLLSGFSDVTGFSIVRSPKKIRSNELRLKHILYYFAQHKRDYAGGKTGLDKITINWIVPIPTIGGGGHTNIFNLVNYLNSHGFKNRIYFSNFDRKAVKDDNYLHFINKYYLDIQDTECYDGAIDLHPADISIATAWQTAYYLIHDDSSKHKCYYIQDYEPYFYPMSEEYIMAENTYKFGFKVLCAGKWLYSIMKEKYHQDGIYFNLGVDKNLYRPLDRVERKNNRIFIYFRPSTYRRGSELLLNALEVLYAQRPDVEIIMAGSINVDYEVNFAYTNLGILNIKDLPEVYNSCSMAIVCSLTNYSLLPCELMACKTLVLDMEGENNRSIYGELAGKVIALSEPDPYAIAEKVRHYLDNPDEGKVIIENAYQYINNLDWEITYKNIQDYFHVLLQA